jgi:hypothetical protein
MKAHIKVNVDPTAKGMWEVVVPGRGDRIVCATLQEAVRAGQRYAARRQPCELVVHDAYHRVVRRELSSPSPA